jgi:4-amino-4-deoxy-L-arabinose transferase-like glycosyltransferase
MILEEKFKINQINQNKGISFIILLALVVRILFLLTVSDIKNLNYYEYGEIVKNIQHGYGYSLFYFENDSLRIKYKIGTEPFKSAYMPPGYALFLYPFFLINDDIFRNIFILLIQIIISSINVFLLFRLTSHMFSKNVAIIAALIYALLPEFIYASCNINIVVLYHTGILAFFYMLVNNKIFSSYLKLAVFILVIVFLIYLRFEFIVFILLFGTIGYKELGIKKLAIIYLSLLILLSPWLIRNYTVFQHFPLLSTSTGLNLFRGHNEHFIGYWGDEKLERELAEFQNNPNYEYQANRIYSNKAIHFILNHPQEELQYSFQKLFHLWVFNQDDIRTGNLFYKLPALLILFAFLLGLSSSYSIKKYNFFYLYFLYFSLLSVAFFVLPRYQTMLKVLLIPFAAYGIIQLWNFIKVKFN